METSIPATSDISHAVLNYYKFTTSFNYVFVDGETTFFDTYGPFHVEAIFIDDESDVFKKCIRDRSTKLLFNKRRISFPYFISQTIYVYHPLDIHCHSFTIHPELVANSLSFNNITETVRAYFDCDFMSFLRSEDESRVFYDSCPERFFCVRISKTELDSMIGNVLMKYAR